MTPRASLTILMENSVEPSETFTAPCLRTRESLFFFQRQIRMNCCFGHVKLNFTTLPITLSPNCFNFFAQSPQTLKKHSFSKKLLTVPLDIWKTILTFLRKTFLRNPKIFWLNFLKFFPGSFERTNLSPKDYIWRKEKLLKSLLQKTHQKPNFHHSIKEKVENNFLVENAFLKLFLWTRKLQFERLAGNIHQISEFLFFQCSKKGKLIVWGNVSSDVPLET